VFLSPRDSSGPYFERFEGCGQSLKIASSRNLISGLAKGKEIDTSASLKSAEGGPDACVITGDTTLVIGL
jgi:predicted house-cleaning NTP pyrophosphatase (Maf/HAM1 superfamily)